MTPNVDDHHGGIICRPAIKNDSSANLCTYHIATSRRARLPTVVKDFSRLAIRRRSSLRSSAALLKRKARASLSSDRSRSLKSVIVVRPPALPFLTALKNRTVSWCLPGNLGCLFDFLIRSSQPDRSRRSREVQRVRQPCCFKKRARAPFSSARAPVCKQTSS
jgi:hypothetical protein